MIMKYCVFQGLISENGSGDYTCIAKFNNLRQAKKYFNRAKKDIVGWVGVDKHRYIVETFIAFNSKYLLSRGYSDDYCLLLDPIAYYELDLRKFYNI